MSLERGAKRTRGTDTGRVVTGTVAGTAIGGMVAGGRMVLVPVANGPPLAGFGFAVTDH